MMITSMRNPRVQSALRLRERRARQEQGRTIIDGLREIQRALRHRVPVAEVFVDQSKQTLEQPSQIVRTARQRGAQIYAVTPRILEKLAFGNRSEGVVAIANCRVPDLQQCDRQSLRLLAVLDAIEKPGNVGAILRSGDAVGLDAAILTEGGTDLFNPNAIRASLGTVFSVPAYQAPAAEARSWLDERAIQILAADVNGKVQYHAADFTRPTAVVLGSEATGLSAAWADAAVTRIRLPMLGTADSLNVAVAASILFYESLRQREDANVQ